MPTASQAASKQTKRVFDLNGTGTMVGPTIQREHFRTKLYKVRQNQHSLSQLLKDHCSFSPTIIINIDLDLDLEHIYPMSRTQKEFILPRAAGSGLPGLPGSRAPQVAPGRPGQARPGFRVWRLPKNVWQNTIPMVFLSKPRAINALSESLSGCFFGAFLI